VQLDEETKAILDDLTDEETGDYASGSAAVREALRRFDEIEAVRARRDDLRRQLTAQNRRSGEIEEVVDYATGEMEKQERDRERRDAPLWTRARWFVFGRPAVDA
jgi:Arc/MetJ-type ribon-helix-helix transcriptional regulator